jgi:small subunit ribosomal protein S9
MEIINAIGRRKAAVARVYLSKTEGNPTVVINGRTLEQYFPVKEIAQKVMDPVTTIEGANSFSFKINVDGGGMKGQAEAIRMGIARALCKVDADWRGALKEKKFLSRDPREVERKKFGRRKARRVSQFSKR